MVDHAVLLVDNIYGTMHNMTLWGEMKTKKGASVGA